MTEEQMKVELGRAYRAIRGLYQAAVEGRPPDTKMLIYHSIVIGAAIRFVDEGALDGAAYFVGKHASVLRDTLLRVESKPRDCT